MSGDHTYHIELAKSGRSSCRKCKQKIEKGDMRIGVCDSGGEYEVTRYFHLPCYNLPRSLSSGANKITIEQFVDDVLRDQSQEILPAKRDEVVAELSKKATSSSGAPDILAQIKQAYEVLEDEPAPKKVKTDGESFVTADIANAYGFYKKFTNDQLKDVLRWNEQVLKGTKAYLVVKVLDGHVHGRLARCGVCGGKLRLSEDGLNVDCGGRFDEDMQYLVPCSYAEKASKAPRWHPWFTEEPSEEEKEEMERLIAVAKGEDPSAGAEGESDDAVSLLVAAAADLDWSLTSKPGIRAATEAIIKLLNEAKKQVDIPTDPKEATRSIGPIIDANRDKSAQEIIPLIVKQLGFAEDKKKKAESKENAVSNNTKVESNVPIVMAMDELKELYFKEGNRNAGATYSKVVKVLQELDFEITEENALGLGKGKTKVEGIGKSTAEKIHEFMSTGTIAKLDEKRALL